MQPVNQSACRKALTRLALLAAGLATLAHQVPCTSTDYHQDTENNPVTSSQLTVKRAKFIIIVVEALGTQR